MYQVTVVTKDGTHVLEFATKDKVRMFVKRAITNGAWYTLADGKEVFVPGHRMTRFVVEEV